MPYSAEINRANPGCFIFVVDQSYSMAEPIGGDEGDTRRKADVVAESLNRFLSELSIRCAKDEGVRDYFDVAVIGYGSASAVESAYGGALAGRMLVPISEVATSPTRVEDRTKKIDDGAGGLVERNVKFPVWVDPVAVDGTPMVAALTEVQRLAADWLSSHPASFPPIVVHFTDGDSTDGDPTHVASTITDLSGPDGDALLFNCHVSSTRANPLVFAGGDSQLPDAEARLLFTMSSVLPPPMLNAARDAGFTVSEGSRGFAFNADAVTLVQFLDIGTRTPDLR